MDIAERRRRERWNEKIAVLKKLGGKCRCGVSDFRVLQINHKNGGGSKESDLYGHGIYEKILSGTRTTEDLEVRCANCNILYEYEQGHRRSYETHGE